ncbi:response regulator transcription factor [Fervidibacillus halotolerans]|uniref:Response regulator n=1 Tax=Fervidibacillus halotolerans TaxID=2980027 RepID=A0A9E8M1D8_9BACI|nr:response regulator [Fervidibacillus halotolerans]WAA13100.1 response regulator [Fervidibacillus halotolerans]
MFKIVLIEDEDIIRNGLKFSIDWAALDCTIVGEAKNGEEGISVIEACNPDIVFLDINMPVKNGLELLEDCDGKFSFSTIIISGYNDFKYAQMAIKFGVTEYLLKPVDRTELVDALNRAKSIVELRKNYRLVEENIKNPESIEVLQKKWLLREHNQTSKYVAEIIRYIQSNYDQKISMNDLVEPLGMSITFLNQKFKEETGITFNDFLNRYRVHKAMEILKKGNMKITILATEVGFSDYRYFIQVFKKYTGMNPSDFVEYFKTKNDENRSFF